MIRTAIFFIICFASPFTTSAQGAFRNDVEINEVLFNPSSDGYDYVELLNRSPRRLFLKDMMIGNRNVTNDVASLKAISKDSLILDPGSYCVLTTNEKWLKQEYRVPADAFVVEVSSLPSFPDDEGDVVLVRKEDTVIIDEVRYDEKWHFQTITDRSGISLERISADIASQQSSNWTSASSTSGFGTPGYVNSQKREPLMEGFEMSVLPRIFSPDNDGVDDFAYLTINTSGPGKVANAIIYDASGRRVRYIVRNEILGTTNTFKWDGYDDRAQKLGTGIYIVVTQIFDMNGNVSKHRNCVVLDVK